MPDSPRQTNVINTATVQFADTQAGLTAATSYGCVTTGAGFAPTANLIEVPATGCAPKGRVAAASSWELQIKWLQDWNTAAGGGLSGFMFTNDGLKKWCVVTPTSPTLPAFTAQVTIVAGQIFGTFGDLLVAESTCPTEGKPTATLPVTAATAAADDDEAEEDADAELVDA